MNDDFHFIDENTPDIPKFFVYGLFDPETKHLRYVGQTIHALERRLKRHIKEAQKGLKTHKCCWIRSLLTENKTPEIALLEDFPNDVSKQELDDAEIYWIEQFKSLGCELTNCTKGGDGITGMKLSDEHKAKLSVAQMGRIYSDAARANMSKAQKLAQNMPEVKKKQSAASKLAQNRPETKAKRSATWNRQEVKAKLSVALKLANSRPEVKEKRRVAQKLVWAKRRILKNNEPPFQ